MMKVRAGIDIGGTKARIGLVDSAGGLIVLADKIAMSQFEHGDELMLVIANTIKTLVAADSNYELMGVGVGAPGPLNDTHETVMETPNTPVIQNYPLVARLQRHFDVPVKMNNDANVFVLGEAISGAGKGEALVYGITLGTGYGHGFVWDGRILSGAHGTATEYGLAPYNDGTFEDYASGPALERNYANIAGESRNGLEIFELAKAGDANALAANAPGGRILDTDQDGIPDQYEDDNGLDKNNADDGAQDAGSGYTNLEEYCHYLANELITGNNRLEKFGRYLSHCPTPFYRLGQTR